MLLNNGSEVTVLGEVLIEDKKHYICRLSNAVYVNGVLVRLVVLSQNEFKAFVDRIHADTMELVVDPSKEVVEGVIETPAVAV